MRFLILPENSSLSHIAKTLAMTAELKSRGHQVDLAVSRARSPFLTGLGMAHEVLPDIQEADGSGYPTAEWFRDPARFAACVRAETALMARLRPDRVLGVFRSTARASTQLAGIPYDALACGCMLPDYQEPLGFGPDDPGRAAQVSYLDTFYRYAGDRASRALTTLGLEKVADIRTLLTGDRTFLWDLPEFNPLPAGAAATHVGPLAWHGWPHDQPALAAVLASPLPLAIITFGTCVHSARASARLVRLLLAMDFQVLLAAGGQAPMLAAAAGHPRLTVCNFAPLHLLFPHAALTICHGGQLTVFEALAGGCPVLVLPLQPEQAHNGLCLARLGCGGSLVPAQPFLGSSRVYVEAMAALSDPELTGIIQGHLDRPGLAGNLAAAKALLGAREGVRTLADALERP